MIYVFLADGFEECEALVPTDILLRAGFELKTVGVTGKNVKGSHSIEVVCDLTDKEITTDNLEAIILPGGMPGTLNLEKSNTVQKFIDYAYNNNLIIGAICAAPSILGHKGILKGKNATCFTGFEKDLIGAKVTGEPVEVSGNIITAYGAGAAFPFGFELLSKLTDEKTSENMKKQMRY